LRQAGFDDRWFVPLTAIEGNILNQDFTQSLADAGRVLLFWDAHGFDVAEVVLGKILPKLIARHHLVAVHDVADLRYQDQESLLYGGHGLWRGTGDEPHIKRLKIGFLDSAEEQLISIVDFATRNGIPLHTSEESFHTELSEQQAADLSAIFGEMYSPLGQWLYFSLSEASRPLTFPRVEMTSVASTQRS
jgi:hypothetical protein